MPALPPRSSEGSQPKILVTGATGYVGQWVLRTVLDRGYNARVVVRSTEKAEGVKKLFSSPADEDKLEFAVVPDLAKEGAFDEAIVDVDGAIHVATPLPQHEENLDGYESVYGVVLYAASLRHGQHRGKVSPN